MHWELEINERWNCNINMLRLLDYEINDILKDLEFKLKHGTLKNRYFKKWNCYKDEIKLRLAAN